ncbi:MAG: rRNA maturation RNase YbeY, partial [Candidatus Harrisonbacteria bacterium]|nr:rRNA maturation RNase YbeY [Candidatus Harrisonbacteria bacterium]
MLDIVFRNSFNGQEWPQVFFEKIVLCAIKELHWQDKAVEVSISLVGEDKIRALNKTYRNKDAVTDVLSFPLGDVPEVPAPHLPLGDIFICLPKAVRNAEQENMPLKKKLAWLTIH